MAKKGIGGYAFLIGIILAIILGLVTGLAPTAVGSAAGAVVLILVILGLIVGFLNVKDEHINEFLVAVIAVLLIGMIPINTVHVFWAPLGTVLANILQNIVAFAAPAALVVGLKQIWVLGYAGHKK